MLSVQEVAKAAGVSSSAVRARLAEGQLRGTRTLNGQRWVWEIHEDDARAYVESHGRQLDVGAATHQSGQRVKPKAAATLRMVDTQQQPTLFPEDLAPASERPEVATATPAASPVDWLSPDPGTLDREGLLEENARLRAGLIAISRAHEALTELVGVAMAHSSRVTTAR